MEKGKGILSEGVRGLALDGLDELGDVLDLLLGPLDEFRETLLCATHVATLLLPLGYFAPDQHLHRRTCRQTIHTSLFTYLPQIKAFFP